MQLDAHHHDDAIQSASVVRSASVVDPNLMGLEADTKDATSTETEMTFWQAIKLYKKAVGWSLLLSTAVVMEGYDLALISNFYALPQFLEKFGTETLADGTKNIPAPVRSALNNGVLIGQILGLMGTGIFQDHYGYKKTIGGALALMIAFLFIVFFAQNIGMLIAGEVLCGWCWGVFQTITTTYASEVTPVRLRAYLTTYVNICWVVGQLIAAGVLRGMLTRDDQWAYRIPFALQWMWPLPILIGCCLCPESPWWLVRKDRADDAKKALRRLTSPNTGVKFDIDKTIAMIDHTNRLERELIKGTSYLDCFRGVNLRRTEIVCFTWLTQVYCGMYFAGYSTSFFQRAGLPVAASFNLSIGQSAMGVFGTVGSWFLMNWAGRRTIYLYGTWTLALIMFVIGFMGIAKDNVGAQWSAGSLLLVFVFVYDFTVGPVCYSLIAELPSTRLKAKSVVLARNVYNVGGIVANVLINYQLTPTAWDWGAYCGFFWGGTCVICAVWIYFRLPEPKGRTYGELDILFENKVPARLFSRTVVSLDGENHGIKGSDDDSLGPVKSRAEEKRFVIEHVEVADK